MDMDEAEYQRKRGDNREVALLRATIHQMDMSSQVAMLCRVASASLRGLPPSRERAQGDAAVDLAAGTACGRIDPSQVVAALHDEDDTGIMLIHQAATEKREIDIWAAVVGIVGYAAWCGYARTGRHPSSLVQGYADPDALDLVVDLLNSLDGVDLIAMIRAGEPLWNEEASPAYVGT